MPRHEDVWWSGGIAPPLLTSSLDEGDSSLSRLGRAPEPVWELWRKEITLLHTENQTPVVQPVARRYTELSRQLIIKGKVKLSLYRAMESHRVVKR
jgi:hypothetical protein